MEIAGDSKTWLSEASEVVPLLLQKSLDVTSALIELSKCVQRAHQASTEFMHEYFSSNKITGNKRLGPHDRNDEILFVSVITSLANDGTFWCKFWTSKSKFDSNDIQQLSDELGWMEKEMTAKRVDPLESLNKPLFTFSNKHNMYVRLIILKFAPPEQTSVRYLDFGSVGEISPNCVFYHVPHNIEKTYPYKTMFCALHEDEFTNLPYEAKWKFRDLTCHQVLMVKVVKRISRKGIPCCVVEMKPLTDEASKINQDVIEKVKGQETVDEAKHPISRNVIINNNYTELLSSQKDVDLKLFKKPYPVVDPVSTDDNDNSNCTTLFKDVANPEIAMKRGSEEPQASNRSRSPEMSKIVSLNKIRSCSLSSLPGEMPKPLPMFHSTESLVNHQKGNTLESFTKFSKGSKESINRKKPVPYFQEAFPPKNKLDNKGKKSRKSGSNDGKRFRKSLDQPFSGNSNKSTKEGQKEGEYWVDLIPHSVRQQVRPIIPPLLNLFYSATQLRSENWREIELMNVERLLMSQANMKFYSYDVSCSRLQSSFEDGYLELPNHVKDEIYEARKSCSVYLILRSFVPSQRPQKFRRQILGIARLKSGTPVADRRYPISYYTLSALDNPKNEWIQKIYNYFTLVSLKDAKAVIQHYAVSLHSGRNEPVFPDIYPWSGIPPLMNIVKCNAGRKVSNSSYNQVKNDNFPVSAESWDTEVDEHSCADVETGKQEDNPVEEKQVVAEKEIIQPMKILQRSESLSVSEGTQCNNDVSTLPEGYFGTSGVWYPSIEAAMVSAGSQQQNNMENADIDMNQNILCSTRSSESEGKSDEKDLVKSSMSHGNLPDDVRNEVPLFDKDKDFENDSGLAIDFERSVDQLLKSASNSLLNVNVDEEVPNSQVTELLLISGS